MPIWQNYMEIILMKDKNTWAFSMMLLQSDAAGSRNHTITEMCRSYKINMIAADGLATHLAAMAMI